MEELLGQYSIDSIEEYYQLISDSYINGQKKQAKEQLLAMPRNEQREYVKSLRPDGYETYTDGGRDNQLLDAVKMYDFMLDVFVDNLPSTQA